jgi:Na+-translocating ferredoxin:NAD+ oxidoreductase RNF subunit RnfB
MPVAELFIAGGLMAGLGISLTSVLALANKKLHVFEDPRIDQVEEMLPSANCGACGNPGCRAFAEAVVAGQINPGRCTVNTPEMIEAIANLLGVAVSVEHKRVARLACAGGSHVSWMRAHYEGLRTCRAAALVAGGGKMCSWGCLGLGDCAQICPFDAISMDRHGLPVVDERKCTACGDCVAACPKGLFSIHPVSHRLWVACRNLAAGDEAERVCEVACTGCGRCALAAPDAIQIKNNLAVVDYQRNGRVPKDAIDRCPTGALVWCDEKGRAIKGEAAKKITRRTPLPPMMN